MIYNDQTSLEFMITPIKIHKLSLVTVHEEKPLKQPPPGWLFCFSLEGGEGRVSSVPLISSSHGSYSPQGLLLFLVLKGNFRIQPLFYRFIICL